MKLSTILKDITELNFTDCEIDNITLDSREVKNGYLFCAIKGHKLDARKFISQTIASGATAIIADSDQHDYIETLNSAQIIYIKNLSAKLSKIADNFYQSPSKQMKLVGITGTNGKTTISQIICQWSEILGQKSASMGTIGNGVYGGLKTAENTTGNAFDIQKNLANFYKQKAYLTAMEVSSHGLIQGRVNALDFNVAIFTNLTQDHLDYHNTMDEYFKAKALLFTQSNNQYNIININDPYGKKLTDLIENKDSIIKVSAKEKCNNCSDGKYVCVNNIEYSNKGIAISFYSSWGNGVLTTQLIGPFNVSNLLQSFAAMLALGFNKEDLCNSAEKLNPVIGRMEVFKKKCKPTIIVDYAHTPDALEKALQAARIHTVGDLWCIFGCGGDRDTTKRPLMATTAENFADKIIITNDNPRTEDENIIINDILKGISNKENIEIILDRFDAIEYAIKNAHKTDIILVAGKGHEDYQIIGTEKNHYSDRESACKLLKVKDCIC